MREFKKQNDYSVSVFSSSGFLAKYNYVGNLYGFSEFLNKNFPNWQYMNVYARRTGRYLLRYKRGDFITPFPVL